MSRAMAHRDARQLKQTFAVEGSDDTRAMSTTHETAGLHLEARNANGVLGLHLTPEAAQSGGQENDLRLLTIPKGWMCIG